jgi:hypothetical protein
MACSEEGGEGVPTKGQAEGEGGGRNCRSAAKAFARKVLQLGNWVVRELVTLVTEVLAGTAMHRGIQAPLPRLPVAAGRFRLACAFKKVKVVAPGLNRKSLPEEVVGGPCRNCDAPRRSEHASRCAAAEHTVGLRLL